MGVDDVRRQERRRVQYIRGYMIQVNMSDLHT